jgi:hypothetical protein
MTDTVTSQNIDLSSRITHYSYILVVYLKTLRRLGNRTWIVVVWGLFDVLTELKKIMKILNHYRRSHVRYGMGHLTNKNQEDNIKVRSA